MGKTQLERTLVGLKVKQKRLERGWSFEELGRQSGISVSYLNEIEKGKKSPGPSLLNRLSAALGVSVAELTEAPLKHQLAPVERLLRTHFLEEIPLELFGIEHHMIVDIIARAPEKVNAFISALLEIARRYSVGGEHFYLAALRAYQELRNNYIEEVEAAVEDFRERTGLGLGVPVREAELILYLSKRHQIRVDLVRMEAYPELSGVRSVWNSRRKILYLHPDLNEHQRVYQLCKACGFAYLGLKNRPDSSFVDRIQGFEGVLDNYLAAYFAVALLLSRRDFEADTRIFLQERTWNPGHLDWMLQKYQVSPEVLFQRFNLITVQTPLTQVFFMRMFHDLFLDQFTIDKELHLGRRHTPHSSGLKEHYCRRWLPVELLRRLQQQATSSHLSGVQRVTFKESGEVYLLLSIAKSGQPFPNRNICTTIGILVDETCRGTIGFWDDEGIPEVVVNVTCERCSLSDCLERAAPPLVVESRERRRKLLESIKELSD